MKQRYIIVSAETLAGLEGEVNQYMEDGYLPVGSPFIYRERAGQALYLPERQGL